MIQIILIHIGGYGPGKWYHSDGPYNESARNYECVFFYVDGLYRENVTFEIEYEMKNAALRYGDCSELYLSLYSEDSIKHLNSFNAQILIPEKDMPQVGNYEAYTYGTNSNRFPFTESDTINPGYHTFSFNLDKSQLKFRPYNEYIEFSLISYGQDSHIFTDYASRNLYYNDDALLELREEQEEYEETYENYMIIKSVVLLIFIIISYLIVKRSIKRNRKVKEEHIFYSPTIQVEYFRDIPSNLDPVFASTLAFCKQNSRKTDSDGYSSLLLSLVRKGYVELDRINNLHDWTSDNVKIIVKYKPTPIMNDFSNMVQNNLNTYNSNVNNLNLFNQISQSDSSFTGPNDINSTVVGIQDKESITLVNSDNMESTTSIEENKLEPLTQNEQQYFNLIVRYSHGVEISMKDFQSKVSIDYENTNSFVRNIKNSIVNIGVSKGYFQKADFEQPKNELTSVSKNYMIFGILFITLVNLISYHTHLDLAFGAFFILGFTLIGSSLYLRKVSKKYVLLTQFGEDEYVKWKGLYDFLNSETLMSERTVVELPLWEQYLVYATSFGISEKVIKALKIRCPDMDLSPMLSNPYYTSRYFRYSSHSFRTATRSASHTARSGGLGGFGGHGGYGGGGRGGGGGRRRTLIF